jgi:Flp pilus assembly protein TadD
MSVGSSRIHRASCGLLFFWLLASGASATLETATVRGAVVDEKGEPVPEVKVELEFKGETRVKVVKTLTTDKKGKFVRVGLPAGKWTMTVTKQGFDAQKGDTDLVSGINELPMIKMKAGAAGQKTAESAAEVDEAAKHAERIRQLGDVYNKAITSLKAGQNAEAEALFKEVLLTTPNLPEAHYNLGYLYMKRSDHPAAEAAFRRAIELEPAKSDSYIALAGLLGETKRGSDALELLSKAAPSFPRDARLQFALGLAALDAGQSVEAQAAFLKAVEADPADAESGDGPGTVRRAQGEEKIAQREGARSHPAAGVIENGSRISWDSPVSSSSTESTSS